jgi:hypothetical protein
MPNELVFTVSQEIQPPDVVDLGGFLATQYERIRVLAFCQGDAEGQVELVISHVEGGGGGLLDRLLLDPGASVNRVYEVPGVMLALSALATSEASSSVTVWIWGFRTSPLGGGDGGEGEGEGPTEVFLPDDAITLSGVSPMAFNPEDAELRFELADAQFGLESPAVTVLTVNDQVVADTQMTIAANLITATEVLIRHRNIVRLASIDGTGRPLHFNETIWAGVAALKVTLRNPDDSPFLEEATVRVSLVDDQAVYEEATTDTGLIEFANVPNATIMVQATASGNRVGTAGGVGWVGNLAVTVAGVSSPSPIANNDFSQGTDGWNIASAPSAQIVPHQETAGPPPGATTLVQQPAPSDDPTERQRRNTQLQQELAQAAPTATPSASIVDNDLMVDTQSTQAQFVSRTFQTDPDVSAVHLRYRFVTKEVPGGYFGRSWNDYYSILVRSQSGGDRVFDVNSMNGLGLAAFSPDGSTAWRDVTLPVDIDGDVIEVELGVANVGDTALDSQIILDFVEEVRIRVIPSLTWNSTQGGLDLRFTVEGGELPESRTITVSFATGPNYGNRVGGTVFSHDVVQGTATGAYGPVRIPGNTLTNDPPGTTHLVAASSPSSVGALQDVRIGFGPNANPAVVPAAMLDVVKDGLRAAGQANATITSTARTPVDQARAMFNNLVNPQNPIPVNVANQLALYAPPGDAVINEFVNQAAGLALAQVQANAAAIEAAMVAEIFNQGPSNVSRHCADPNVRSVVDVSAAPFNANNAPLFIAAVTARLTNFIDETNNNNCFHLELVVGP